MITYQSFLPAKFPPGSLFFVQDAMNGGIHLMIGWYQLPNSFLLKFIAICNGSLIEYSSLYVTIILVDDWFFTKEGALHR